MLPLIPVIEPAYPSSIFTPGWVFAFKVKVKNNKPLETGYGALIGFFIGVTMCDQSPKKPHRSETSKHEK